MHESEVYKRYYRRNMSSSGVEIRINGRLIAYNLFKEIWGIEKHNSYNYLLIKIDIISDDRKKLAVTRTSKNGIRKGDEKLEKVFEWIRSYVSKPVKNQRDIDHEVDLFEKLAINKRTHLPDPKVVNLEHKVLNKIDGRVSIDLYVNSNGTTTIYEGKKDKTTIKDVYQLKMYWDGLTIDGIKPTNGILIAAEHPETVLELMKYVNLMRDVFGNNYNFIVKTWKDEAIDYPKYK